MAEVIVPVVVTTSADGSAQLDKRTYVPGVVLSAVCPKCGEQVERDLSHSYLSYPETNVPMTTHMYHSERADGSDCGGEWNVRIVVRLTIEAANP